MTNTSDTNAAKPRMARAVGTPVIFAEGISQMMLGFPNSRLLLNSGVIKKPAADGSPAEEVHQIACEIIINTAALAELTKVVMNNIFINKDKLAADSQLWVQEFEKTLESLSYNEPPEGYTQYVD